MENRQILTKYQPLKIRRALETDISKLFPETPGRGGILLHLSCWLTLLRTHVNLKSYQSLYSEFTPLPPSVLKCPSHLMSTHSYSWLPLRGQEQFLCWGLETAQLRSASLTCRKDMLFRSPQSPSGRKVCNSRLCSEIYHHHTSSGALSPNSFTEDKTSTHTHSFESPVVHISPTSVLMTLPPGEGR